MSFTVMCTLNDELRAGDATDYGVALLLTRNFIAYGARDICILAPTGIIVTGHQELIEILARTTAGLSIVEVR